MAERFKNIGFSTKNILILLITMLPFVVSLGVDFINAPRMAYFGVAINLSGSQRMRTINISNYIQRLDKAAREDNYQEFEYALEELSSRDGIIESYEEIMQALVYGNQKYSIPRNEHLDIIRQLKNLESDWLRFIATSKSIVVAASLYGIDNQFNQSDINYIVENAPILMEKIDQIVTMFDTAYKRELSDSNKLNLTTISIAVSFTLIGIYLTLRLRERESEEIESLIENATKIDLAVQAANAILFTARKGSNVFEIMDNEMVRQFGLEKNSFSNARSNHCLTIDILLGHYIPKLKRDECKSMIESSLKSIYSGNSSSFNHVHEWIFPNNEYGWVRVQANLLENGDLIGILTDVSSEVKENKRLIEESRLDELTGLKNRKALFYDSKQFEYEKSVFIYLDLDGFKELNDQYGHERGDEALRIVSSRLASLGKNTSAYRMGGDEFLIVTTDYEKGDGDALLALINEPILIQDFNIQLGGSIGVVRASGICNQSLNFLISLSDFAMYTAKEMGKNQIVFADQSLIQRYNDQLNVKKSLSNPLESVGLFAAFQPYVDIETNDVVGFETLVRWRCDGRITFPAEFIEHLENSGRIKNLDLMMFEESLKMLNKLDVEYDTKQPLVASSNFSPISLRQLSVSDVDDVFKKYNIDKSRISLEVTEQSLLNDKACELVYQLTEAGYHIAIDDFSAGYTSLRYLNDLDVKTLKIDRSLINSLYTEKSCIKCSSCTGRASCKSIGIYETVVSMANRLNIDLVAEGIETEEHVDALSLLNVHRAQGFFYSKPKTSADFIQYVIGSQHLETASA